MKRRKNGVTSVEIVEAVREEMRQAIAAELRGKAKEYRRIGIVCEAVALFEAADLVEHFGKAKP